MGSLKNLADNLLPNGEYTIKITDIELGTANGGNEKLTFKGEVRGGGEHDRKRVIYSRPLSPNAIGILANDLIAAGLPDDTDDEIFGDTQELCAQLQGMVGMSFVFKVGKGKPASNGRIYNDFKLEEPAGEALQLGAGLATAESDPSF